MMIQMDVNIEKVEQKRARVLATYQAMQQWPYWNEVYLNCVKESPLSYEAFARAVRTGDASREAFERALVDSQMTQEEFQRYLPEFQKFMALYSQYNNIGMLSDGVDQIWHGFMLVSDRYRAFCLEFVGCIVDHMPCSLYELYGVDRQTSSCIGRCVPSTCKGPGGGCKPEDAYVDRDADPEKTKAGILAGTTNFITAYTEVFGMAPDPRIWNQLVGY